MEHILQDYIDNTVRKMEEAQDLHEETSSSVALKEVGHQARVLDLLEQIRADLRQQKSTSDAIDKNGDN